MTSRYTIDLGALATNYRTVAAATGGGCAAVVKADGYGLGAVAVVRCLLAQGCREFFVANIAEAEDLRREFAEPIIYVFAGATEAHVDRFIAARAIPILNHAAELAGWRNRGAKVAVHIDTGMNRLGFSHAEFEQLDAGDCDIALLVSHLACADDPADPRNALQRERFERARAKFPGVRVSLHNSAGALGGFAAKDELCRPGIALYGGNPFAERANPMRRVARLEAQVLQLRDVEHDDCVGYGASYRARGRRLVATVGAGYADGIPRLLSNLGVAAFGDIRVPYVGRVSMDLIGLDVSELAGRIAVGDWVELVGDVVSIDEVAALARTISYEVLTGLGRRSERVYLD
ncbi:MAG: alanine racemase [Gammaproteobacteria bacterium]|nr:alanine racemase [Gammaproteobacteria bacterium]